MRDPRSILHLSIRILLRSARSILLFIGSIGLLLIILAFTRIPFDAHRALARMDDACTQEVDLIVVLGGSGMPGGPELLRLHYAASEAGRSDRANVCVIHPKDTQAMRMMEEELILKGVQPQRIVRILEGVNTREQALRLADAITARDMRISIVTAPENMYRTMRCFQKAGFSNVCATPAFDHAMFVDLDYDHERIGGRKAVPDVSADLDLRYNFWNYLKLEITCLREYAAIAYYWLNDWI